MKRTKLTFVAALALGLLFCVNDATAQQAVKKVKAQKTVQTQSERAEILKKKSKYTVVPAGYILKPNSNGTVRTPKVTIRERQD